MAQVSIWRKLIRRFKKWLHKHDGGNVKVVKTGKNVQFENRIFFPLIVEEIQKLPHVSFAFDFKKAATAPVPEFLKERALKGYHHDRSGDIIFMLEPGWYGFGKYSSPVGTTHGEWNPYDAHIPLLFYGWKVEHGATSREVHITDIAPTVCQKLHIQQPNACVGEPITEIIDD